MTDSLSSHYDIDTVSDIQPQDWDRFRTDLQALISYFELSPLFQVRPTLTNTVKFSRDSVEVSFRGVEVILCRTRGMTTVRSTFEGVEDLFIRALILIYSHHGRGRTAVFATGSNSAWDIAREVAGQATSREGVSSTRITVDESRMTDVANRDTLVYASIYDSTPSPQTVVKNSRLANEKHWFF